MKKVTITIKQHRAINYKVCKKNKKIKKLKNPWQHLVRYWVRGLCLLLWKRGERTRDPPGVLALGSQGSVLSQPPSAQPGGILGVLGCPQCLATGRADVVKC